MCLARAVKSLISKIGTGLLGGFKAVKAAFNPTQRETLTCALAGAAVGATVGAVTCFAIGLGTGGPVVAGAAALAGGLVGAGVGGVAGAQLSRMHDRNVEQQRQRAANQRSRSFCIPDAT